MKLSGILPVLTGNGVSQIWLARQLGKSFSMVNAFRSQSNLESLLQIAEITSNGFDKIDKRHKRAPMV